MRSRRGTRRESRTNADLLTHRRLRRVHLRLAILLTAVFAVFVGLFAASLTAADRGRRDELINGEMRSKLVLLDETLWVDEDENVVTDNAEENTSLTRAYPQLLAMQWERESGSWQFIFEPESTYWPDADYLGAIDALEDSGTGEDSVEYAVPVEGDDDERLRILARYAAADPRGETVLFAISEVSSLRSVQQRFVRDVVLRTMLAIALFGLLAYMLAGRFLRPAALALQQQERFLADAAHELRTPVAAIRAAAESSMAGDEPAERALVRTESLAAEAGRLLDDLLILARMDAGQQPVEREAVRLDLLVEAVVDSLAADPPVRVETTPVVARVSEPLVSRAVHNLVANAIRHGRVADPAAEIVVRVQEAAVIVEDRGPGIEPGVYPHLFERFRSGRRSGGSGLGLALVAWIADAHGGSITAENRADSAGGARFVFRVPTS